MVEKHLVFFDGVCPMCNWWVRFLLAWDRRDQFLFFPVEAVNDFELPEEVLFSSSETVVVYIGGAWYYKSSAVIELFKQLGFPWRLFMAARFLPLTLRDGLYNFISRNRFKVFQKYDACPIIPLELRDKFPDLSDLNLNIPGFIFFKEN